MTWGLAFLTRTFDLRLATDNSPCDSDFLTFALRLSHSDTTVEPSPRNWARTYVAVIAVEVVVLLGLWWLQRHFGV